MNKSTAIIIVNWNGLRHLEECFRSLQQQTHQDFHLIFVDNGSSDSSIDFTRKHFSQAEIIELKKNHGFAGANNIGIAAALEYPSVQNIVLLNNDTAVEPTWLQELVTATLQHPRAQSFACLMVYYSDSQRVDSAGHRLLRTGRVTNWGQGENVDNYRTPAIVFGACAGAALYRRTFFEQVGVFDETYFAYYEDVDLNWRAALLGLSCVYIPSAIVRHKGAGTSQGLQRFRILSFRNRMIVNSKNLPMDYVLSRLLYIVPFEIFMLAVVLLNGTGVSVLQWLKMLRPVVQQRQSIQKKTYTHVTAPSEL